MYPSDKARLPGTLLLALLAVFTVSGAEKYAVSEIPPSLLKNADAVIRCSEIRFTVLGPDNAVKAEKYAVTILNEKGADQAYFIVDYDRLTKIRKISGTIFDKDGLVVKKMKSSEILDISAVPGGVLYSDDRMKGFDPEYTKYPFTVEYEYEKSYTGLLFYPAWMPQDSYYQSVERAVFSIEAPEENLSGHRSVMLDEPVIETTGSGKRYTWSVTCLAALEPEIYSVGFTERVPRLYTAPGNFSYEGFRGSMGSWKEFGAWIWQLIENRDILPAETFRKIESLVAGAGSDLEKAEIIYRYVQANTRYVAVSLGIGGYQPLEASQVARNGIGECKALTNYTRSLLKAAGIDSYYTVVRAGRDMSDILQDFPSQQFNHVILCVPLDQDTIWLECTNPDIPFGYLGSFTDDRKALLVDKTGGRLVHTRIYPKEENTQISRAHVKIDGNGNALADFTIQYRGMQYETVTPLFSRSFEDQKKMLYSGLNLPDFRIDRISLKADKQIVPKADLAVSAELKSYWSRSGDRVFIPLNLINRREYIPRRTSERMSDVQLRFAYCDTDTVRYTLPPGLTLEHLPERVDIESDFGNYRAWVETENNQLVYVRQICMNKGRYPAARYGELAEFFRQVVKADRMQAVCTHKL